MTQQHDHPTPPPAHTGQSLGFVLMAVVLLAAACTGNSGPTSGAAEPSPASSSPAAPPRSALPSPLPATGLPGLIAYSTQAGDIWVMHADGTNRRRVTHAG